MLFIPRRSQSRIFSRPVGFFVHTHNIYIFCTVLFGLGIYLCRFTNGVWSNMKRKKQIRMQPGDVYRQHRKITWSKKWNKWCTDYVAVLSSSKPHLGWCNRNSAKSLTVRSENPRGSFLSLQRLKTNSLKQIDLKQPGSFGLPTRRHVMVTISSYAGK